MGIFDKIFGTKKEAFKEKNLISPKNKTEAFIAIVVAVAVSGEHYILSLDKQMSIIEFLSDMPSFKNYPEDELHGVLGVYYASLAMMDKRKPYLKHLIEVSAELLSPEERKTAFNIVKTLVSEGLILSRDKEDGNLQKANELLEHLINA